MPLSGMSNGVMFPHPFYNPVLFIGQRCIPLPGTGRDYIRTLNHSLGRDPPADDIVSSFTLYSKWENGLLSPFFFLPSS